MLVESCYAPLQHAYAPQAACAWQVHGSRGQDSSGGQGSSASPQSRDPRDAIREGGDEFVYLIASIERLEVESLSLVAPTDPGWLVHKYKY